MDSNLNGIASSLERLVALQQKGWWDYIATIAVVLTLFVLIWYTIQRHSARTTLHCGSWGKPNDRMRSRQSS